MSDFFVTDHENLKRPLLLLLFEGGELGQFFGTHVAPLDHHRRQFFLFNCLLGGSGGLFDRCFFGHGLFRSFFGRCLFGGFLGGGFLFGHDGSVRRGSGSGRAHLTYYRSSRDFLRGAVSSRRLRFGQVFFSQGFFFRATKNETVQAVNLPPRIKQFRRNPSFLSRRRTHRDIANSPHLQVVSPSRRHIFGLFSPSRHICAIFLFITSIFFLRRIILFSPFPRRSPRSSIADIVIWRTNF